MTVQGFEWDFDNDAIAKAESPIIVDQPFSDANSPTKCGMPITLEAFLQMKCKFLEAVDRGDIDTGDIYAFEVSKASLFRLLSQEGCEMLTFYFVMPDHEGKVSLAIAGKSIDMKLLKMDTVVTAARDVANRRRVATTNTGLDPLMDEKVGRIIGNDGRGVRSLKNAIPGETWTGNFSLEEKFVDFVQNKL